MSEIRTTQQEDLTGRSRIARNVAFAWGGYLVNVIAGFILPRLISDRLGQTTLGIWDFCWSLVGYFGLVQLGLGASIDRYVAHYRATGNRDGLSRSVSTIGLFLKGAALLVLGVTFVTAWWVVPLFHDKLGQELSTGRWVVFLLGIEISATLMFAVYNGIIVGCHRWDIHNLLNALTYAVVAGGMVVVLVMGGGLRALALVHCLVTAAGEMARLWIARKVCPEARVSRRDLCWATWVEQAKYSTKNLMPRIADLLSNQSLAILIATFLGPGMLAMYMRPRNLARHFQTVAAKFGYILVPSASSLHAKADLTDLRKTFQGAAAAIAFLTLPGIMTLAILGDELIRLWMGAAYIHPGLVMVLAIACFPSLVAEPVWGILAGMNQHGKVALGRLLGAICSAVFLWLGLARMQWGLFEAALAFALPQVAIDAGLTPFLACRRLNVSLAAFYWTAYLKPFICVVPYACCVLLARSNFQQRPALSIFLGSGALLLLGGIYWVGVISGSFKAKISAMIRRVLISERPDPIIPKDEGVAR